ncbi:MAG: ATP-binding cassette domain-containing protein [Cyanobacteria bacterium P01_H01_bin.58]
MLLNYEQVSLQAPRGNAGILNAISLGIEPGEFVALVGPSGAGKSSLLKLTNRLKSPSSGAIYLREQRLERIPVIELRRRVMLAGQDSRLLGMTVREALCYPLQLQAMPEAQQNERMHDYMAQLSLPKDWLDRTELDLSGGQQQQVAIARALMTEPEVLLLDEPTAAQDIGTANRILSAVRQQVQQRKLTVIMSNHQLDIAADFCDRLLYLEQGCLVKDMPASAVDWSAMRQLLIEADAHNREEWGEA